jgi:gliding motility-associated-like protein
MDQGIERACFLLTDELGNADTTYLEVTVLAKKALYPVAVGDKGDVQQGNTVTINVLSNDVLNGNMEKLSIAIQPQHGEAKVDANSRVVYTPNKGYCGQDDLTYTVCNENGCDSTLVKITIFCDDLIIYSGFSPNGDGSNETFTVQGVERFPGNKMFVFNRWGNQVFYKEDYNNEWDGKWDGKDLPDGTYFYIFDDGKGTATSKHTGYVQIKR